MSIREIIANWIREKASEESDINPSIAWLEGHVQDIIEDELIDLGYEFDEDNFTWRKP